MTSTAQRMAGLGRPVAAWLTLSVALGFLVIASSVSLAATSAYLISQAALTSDSTQLALAITSVRLFAILRGASRYAERVVSHSASFRILTHVRTWFYASVEPLAPAGLSRYHTGDLLSRVIADVEMLEGFFVRVLLPPLVALLSAAFASALLGSFHWTLGFALLTGLVVGGVVLPLVELHAAREASATAVDARARLNELVLDEIEGLPELLVFDGEGRHAAKALEASRAFERAGRRLAVVRGAGTAMAVLISGATTLAVLAIAIPLVSTGELDGLYLGLVVLVTIAAFEAVQGLPQSFQQLPLTTASARRTFELLDSEPEVEDTGVALKAQEVRPVVLDGVAFSYPGGSTVWRALTLTLDAGKCLAVTGASGSGKSTIVNLLLRFWEYEAGSIAFGGQAVRRIGLDHVRAEVSVVPQDIHLFHSTIRDNLLVADGDATDERIAEACRTAQFDEVVRGLPLGLDTLAGEDGAALSGGERQRLAIARAILKDSPVLVLDEPTASLNPELEGRLAASLAPLIRSRATLLITHHAALLELADVVYDCDEGRLMMRSNRL